MLAKCPVRLEEQGQGHLPYNTPDPRSRDWPFRWSEPPGRARAAWAGTVEVPPMSLVTRRFPPTRQLSSLPPYPAWGLLASLAVLSLPKNVPAMVSQPGV